MKPIQVSVVVIGAGAAGLAAASKLHLAGFNVRVIEAQSRIGGRVFSHEFGDGTGFIEYGAQWIHGDQHAVYDLAKKHDLILTKRTDSLLDEDEATGEFFLSCGRTVSAEEKEQTDDALSFLNDVLVESERRNGYSTQDVDELTTESALRKKFTAFLENGNEATAKSLSLLWAVYDWFVRYQMIDNGCLRLEDLSLRSFTDYGLEGDNTTRLNVPLRRLLDHLSENLPSSIISLGIPVRHVIYDHQKPKPFSVECENGEDISAHHVIVTVSLGVLKGNPGLFVPTLPTRKQQAIGAAGFGGIAKVILRFAEPFWEALKPVSTDGFQLLWLDKVDDNQELPQWCKFALGFDAVRTAKNTLVLWIAPQGALLVEETDEMQLADQCQRLLRMFTGSDDIPFPTAVFREKWTTSPFTRGTYSFISTASAKAGFTTEDLAEPIWEYRQQDGAGPVPGVLFAGEATFPLFWSTVHGAILSGWREADRLISLYPCDPSASH